MVSPWWPKNELIKKMTPPIVVSGKTIFTLWISLKLDNRRPSYDQKGAPWWPINKLSLNLMAPLKPPRKKKLILKILEFYLKKRQNESFSGAHIWESCSPFYQNSGSIIWSYITCQFRSEYWGKIWRIKMLNMISTFWYRIPCILFVISF